MSRDISHLLSFLALFVARVVVGRESVLFVTFEVIHKEYLSEKLKLNMLYNILCRPAHISSNMCSHLFRLEKVRLSF